ncbi:MAG: hypothetical protein ACLU9S_07220 [Oscillospiraceae bacterium]
MRKAAPAGIQGRQKYNNFKTEVLKREESFERRFDAREYERKFLEQKTGSPDMSVHSLYTLYIRRTAKPARKPTTYAG